MGTPVDEEKLAELLQVVKEEVGDVNILWFPDGWIRVLAVVYYKVQGALKASITYTKSRKILIYSMTTIYHFE